MALYLRSISQHGLYNFEIWWKNTNLNSWKTQAWRLATMLWGSLLKVYTQLPATVSQCWHTTTSEPRRHIIWVGRNTMSLQFKRLLQQNCNVILATEQLRFPHLVPLCTYLVWYWWPKCVKLEINVAHHLLALSILSRIWRISGQFPFLIWRHMCNIYLHLAPSGTRFTLLAKST